MRLSTMTVLAIAVLAVTPVRSGEHSRTSHREVEQRYRALLQKRDSLLRQNAILDIEAHLAAGKDPYLLLDLVKATLEFRVRGKAFKIFSFSALSSDENGTTPIDPEAVWERFSGPLAVVELQGGRPELVPPSVTSAVNPTGQLQENTDQSPARTGASPISSDEGILGVDAPAHYYILLDHQIKLHVRTPATQGINRNAMAHLKRMGHRLKTSLVRWWSGGEPGAKNRTDFYLTTDTTTAKQLYHSLLPGEKIYILPPPPPPDGILPVKHDGTATARLSATR